MRNELGVYLLQLTLSDLLYLASLPLWLQYIFQGDDWRNTEWLCQVCGFLLYQVVKDDPGPFTSDPFNP